MLPVFDVYAFDHPNTSFNWLTQDYYGYQLSSIRMLSNGSSYRKNSVWLGSNNDIWMQFRYIPQVITTNSNRIDLARYGTALNFMWIIETTGHKIVNQITETYYIKNTPILYLTSQQYSENSGVDKIHYYVVPLHNVSAFVFGWIYERTGGNTWKHRYRIWVNSRVSETYENDNATYYPSIGGIIFYDTVEQSRYWLLAANITTPSSYDCVQYNTIGDLSAESTLSNQSTFQGTYAQGGLEFDFGSVPAGSKYQIVYYLIKGNSVSECNSTLQMLRQKTLKQIIDGERQWWINWLNKGYRYDLQDDVLEEYINHTLMLYKMWQWDTGGWCTGSDYHCTYHRDSYQMAYAFSQFGHLDEAYKLWTYLINFTYAYGHARNTYPRWQSEMSIVGSDSYTPFDTFGLVLSALSDFIFQTRNETFANWAWNYIKLLASNITANYNDTYKLVHWDGKPQDWEQTWNPDLMNNGYGGKKPYIWNLNLAYMYALYKVSEVADWLGHTTEAKSWRQYADNIAEGIIEHFWLPSGTSAYGNLPRFRNLMWENGTYYDGADGNWYTFLDPSDYRSEYYTYIKQFYNFLRTYEYSNYMIPRFFDPNGTYGADLNTYPPNGRQYPSWIHHNMLVGEYDEFRKRFYDFIHFRVAYLGQNSEHWMYDNSTDLDLWIWDDSTWLSIIASLAKFVQTSDGKLKVWLRPAYNFTATLMGNTKLAVSTTGCGNQIVQVKINGKTYHYWEDQRKLVLLILEKGKTYNIQVTFGNTQSTPHIVSSQSRLASEPVYSNNKFIITVNGPTGTTTTVKVYCGSLGKPARVDGADSWSYDESTKILTLTVTHHSPATVTVSWGLIADGQPVFPAWARLMAMFLVIGVLFYALNLTIQASKGRRISPGQIAETIVYIVIFAVLLGLFLSITGA